MLRLAFIIFLLATQALAMGGRPVNEPNDPMRPDSKVVISKEEAAKLLEDIKQKISAELSGIDVYVNFTLYDDFKISARAWQPDVWIGNYAVEYSVKGTEAQEIKKAVDQIVLEAKKQAENKK